MEKMGNHWPCITCPIRNNRFCRSLLGASSQSDLTPRPRWQEFHRFPAGTTIISQDGSSDRIYVLCDGWAFRHLKLGTGRRQILNFLLSGDLFTSISVFYDKMHFSADALSDVRVSTFQRAAVMARLSNDSHLLSAARQICVDETLYAERLLSTLGQGTAEQRIAFLFLRIAEQLSRDNVITNHRYYFPLRLEHIADAVGLTTVHVSRVISSLRKRKVIDISQTHLTFLDPAMVERLASL